MKIETTVNNLIKIVNDLSISKRHYQVFKKLIEICSITEHQRAYHFGGKEKDESYNILEKRYLELVKKDTPETEKSLIVKFYSELFNFFLSGNYADILGVIYHKLELSNKNTGQFFTPYHISEFMAEISMEAVQKTIDKQGYFTVSDPCVGAGGMVIAAASVLNKRNITKDVMIFQAIDIDELCFYMAYTQLSMLGLSGVVIWGDSLSLNKFSSRKTPALILAENETNKEFIKKLEEIKPPTDNSPPSNTQLSLF